MQRRVRWGLAIILIVPAVGGFLAAAGRSPSDDGEATGPSITTGAFSPPGRRSVNLTPTPSPSGNKPPVHPGRASGTPTEGLSPAAFCAILSPEEDLGGYLYAQLFLDDTFVSVSKLENAEKESVCFSVTLHYPNYKASFLRWCQSRQLVSAEEQSLVQQDFHEMIVRDISHWALLKDIKIVWSVLDLPVGITMRLPSAF